MRLMMAMNRINIGDFMPNIECANTERPIEPEPIEAIYIWSVSVPSFVCVGPMYKRKL